MIRTLKYSALAVATVAEALPYRLVIDSEGLALVAAALDDEPSAVALDLETTGLNPRTDRVRLLSVAATTIDGEPYRSFAATAFMIRSGPTSRGESYSIGMPVRMPGPITSNGTLAQRSARCSYSGISRGTVDERQIPSSAETSRKSASSAPSSSPVRCASVAIRQCSPSTSPS